MHRERGGVVAPTPVHKGIRAFQMAMNMVWPGKCPRIWRRKATPFASCHNGGPHSRVRVQSSDDADKMLQALRGVLGDRLERDPIRLNQSDR